MKDDQKSVPLNVTMSDVLIGVSLMGSISVDTLPMLLSGQLDRKIGIFLFYKEHNRLPEFEKDLGDGQVVQLLERLKNLYRREITDLLRQEARNEAVRQQKALAEASKRFVAMNQPAPEGSVDDLAARYGVSKSHVRRLKRDGRLHELASQHTGE